MPSNELPPAQGWLVEALLQGSLSLTIDSKGFVLASSPPLTARLGLEADQVTGESLADRLDGYKPGSAAFRKLIGDWFKQPVSSALLQLQDAKGVSVAMAASIAVGGDPKAQTATLILVELSPDQLEPLNEGSAAEQVIQHSMVVIDFDPQGVIETVNPHGLALIGYKLSELRGKQEDVLLTTTVFESDKCQHKWQHLKTGKTVSQLCQFYTKDGSELFLEATYLPVLDSQGDLRGITMVGCDVSATENRLRKAFAMMQKKSTALDEALQEAREAHQMREEMDRALQALATPVTPIWDGVLLLPLVGIVDSTRTDDAMKTTLDKISATGAKMFILDISGVPSVDTSVANQLIKITKATKIMGCETIVSGVSSSIAHTIVELGIDIGEMVTTSSLRDAVSISLERVNKDQKGKKKGKKLSKKSKPRP